jgi:hypothetical protein
MPKYQITLPNIQANSVQEVQDYLAVIYATIKKNSVGNDFEMPFAEKGIELEINN